MHMHRLEHPRRRRFSSRVLILAEMRCESVRKPLLQPWKPEPDFSWPAVWADHPPHELGRAQLLEAPCRARTPAGSRAARNQPDWGIVADTKESLTAAQRCTLGTRGCGWNRPPRFSPPPKALISALPQRCVKRGEIPAPLGRVSQAQPHIRRLDRATGSFAKSNFSEGPRSTIQRPIALHRNNSLSNHEVDWDSGTDIKNALLNALPVEDILWPSVSRARHYTKHVFSAERDARPLMRFDLRSSLRRITGRLEWKKLNSTAARRRQEALQPLCLSSTSLFSELL
jgi:hypothetical protein